MEAEYKIEQVQFTLNCIMLALNACADHGGLPLYEGEDESSNPSSFQDLVMQYMGNEANLDLVNFVLDQKVSQIVGKAYCELCQA